MASNPNNKLIRAARMEVERGRSATRLHSDPVEVLQEILDGAVADLRYAQSKVDALPDDEAFRDTAQGVVPNEWIRLRDRYRDELERMTNNMVRAGIADRAVRVSEAKAALMVAAIKDAALDIGLPGDQVRALGEALRRRIQEHQVIGEIEAGESE
ncbi:hypothetical protein [Baekduia sp. Peel2402]|uniref:hypothetical protein n=1 Tax=Baekduia sp. Peel2402 TaxID=3458296 RepID=UPI00403E5A72